MKSEVLLASSINEVAKVMAESFLNSPGYTYVFQNDETYRRSALEWLFEKKVSLIHRRCPTALRGVLNEKGEVIACYLWIPSLHQNIPILEMIVGGLWQFPFRFGLSTLQRLLHAMDSQDHGEESFREYYDSSDVIMLEHFVVRPDYQSKGIGRKLLQEEINLSGNSTLLLSTQEDRNVKFYESLGYVITSKIDVAQEDQKYSFSSWFLIRKAN